MLRVQLEGKLNNYETNVLANRNFLQSNDPRIGYTSKVEINKFKIFLDRQMTSHIFPTQLIKNFFLTFEYLIKKKKFENKYLKK